MTSSCRGDVVVALALGHVRPHREDRLGAIECLNVGLLVDAGHKRCSGRVHVKSDDVGRSRGTSRPEEILESLAAYLSLIQ